MSVSNRTECHPVLWLDGNWRKASDALLHAQDGDGNRHMEYVNHGGIYSDLPLEEILQSRADLYGSDQVVG